jgi:hypothetical protein
VAVQMGNYTAIKLKKTTWNIAKQKVTDKKNSTLPFLYQFFNISPIQQIFIARANVFYGTFPHLGPPKMDGWPVFFGYLLNS